MGRLAFDFAGEVALVTGAAAGIGRAVADALASAGARVHGLDRASPEGAVAWTPHELDLRDPRRVEETVTALLAREGRLDHLVSVAGVTRDGMLWKLSDEAWRDVLDVNLTGAFHVLRAVAPAMRAAGRGRVVQVASINGLRGKAGQSNYCASKAGLIALTRSAARELGRRGVTVNAVAPGMIETAMSAALPEEVRERARLESALERLGRPEDVVGAVLFLLSDAAAHVTGVVLPVDGGQLA